MHHTSSARQKSAHKSVYHYCTYNARPIDSANFAQPMSYDSTNHSPSHVHLCHNSLASSTRIVSYIGRQYVRTVPNVDIVGSSKCHTRHLATGGIACFNNVLATNSNPVTTCASDGQVNPYPNIWRACVCTGMLQLLDIQYRPM
jgi:hypothetical protein